jgi:hypothetical protein
MNETMLKIEDVLTDALADSFDEGFEEGHKAGRGYFMAEALPELLAEAKLKGFEEGYDEAKLVFDPEGGYEDVRVQAYDRGFRAGQDDALKQCEHQNYDPPRQRLGGHGC